MKKNIFKNKIKGFTILETLITLLAISIMIAGPVTFVYKSFEYNNFVKQKVIATGLSSEALELATSLRNLDLAQFQAFASACSSSCYIDWNGQGATAVYGPCTGEGCRLALIPVGDGFAYRNTLGDNSDFYRYVKVTQNGTQSYTIDATTYSKYNNIDLNVTLRKVIFNIDIK